MFTVGPRLALAPLPYSSAAAEAWPAAAVAGTASSTTAAQAVSSRDFLDKTRRARVLSITLSSG